MKVVIIGGVAGGATAAARLRRLDEKAEIVVFEKSGYVSYANCGLPYYIGGDITDKKKLTLQTPESFKSRFNIDIRVKNEVTSINPKTKTVTVKDLSSGKEYSESYDKLILSPGAKAVVPPIKGVESAKVFTLRTVEDTFKIKDYTDSSLPKSAAVIGGGFIGLEMAENLMQRGIAVTLIEQLNQVMPPLDFDMAQQIHGYLRQKGVNLMLGKGVESFEETACGLKVGIKGGESVLCDMAVLSVGVAPDSSLCAGTGIELGFKGGILTDEHMRTSVPDIYAVGDAVIIKNAVTRENSLISLAGPANKQGRIAADNICGIESAYKGAYGSSVIKLFDMTAASTGINEKTARRLGLKYDKVFTYSASHASYYPGGSNMSVKVLFDTETGKILGGQIVGFDGVDKRIDVLATAIAAGMTYEDLSDLDLAYAPPYSSAKDPVNMVGYIIGNLMSGEFRQYHWHDVPALQANGGVTLLDVRKPEEYEAGHIDGTVLIPLDELRQRMGELDKSRPVYINCRSGQRSYIACRMLSQNGFECYNLAGGYQLYGSVMRDFPLDDAFKAECGIKL